MKKALTIEEYMEKYSLEKEYQEKVHEYIKLYDLFESTKDKRLIPRMDALTKKIDKLKAKLDALKK